MPTHAHQRISIHNGIRMSVVCWVLICGLLFAEADKSLFGQTSGMSKVASSRRSRSLKQPKSPSKISIDVIRKSIPNIPSSVMPYKLESLDRLISTNAQSGAKSINTVNRVVTFQQESETTTSQPVPKAVSRPTIPSSVQQPKSETPEPETPESEIPIAKAPRVQSRPIYHSAQAVQRTQLPKPKLPIFETPFAITSPSDRTPTTVQNASNLLKQLTSSQVSTPQTQSLSTDQESIETLLRNREQKVFEIKPNGVVSSEQLRVESNGGLISVLARNAKLRDVVTSIAQKEKLNLAYSDALDAPVSLVLHDVSAMEAIDAVLSIAGYQAVARDRIIHVVQIANAKTLSPSVQGRAVQVFHLDFIAAEDLDLGIKTMLSPTGVSTAIKSDPTNNMKTQETVVVEDIPQVIDRIRDYITQVDLPPRQVQIEVQVLQVNLKKNDKHGVDFENIAKLSGNEIRIGTVGGNVGLGAQSFYARVSGGNLTALIDALKSSTDAKTLASPRIIALNGQQAKLQVGSQLGFRVITTTQTATLEDVRFIDVGVVLTVTPRISRDGRILLKVKPEVSTGQINPETGLPEEDTSEVETNLLLDDGQGIVIGGLIQERDINTEGRGSNSW